MSQSLRLAAVSRRAWSALACGLLLSVPATGCAKTEPPPRSVSRARRVEARLELAGSGGALLLAERLASVFRRDHPELRVVVHPSIGSSGAVRALADGAIDLGLLTRPPKPVELASIGEIVELARTEVVLVAHPDAPVESVTTRELPGLFAGRARWRDGGRAVPVIRESGDSAQEALADGVPGLRATLERQWRELRYRIVFHDTDLVSIVSRVPGAFGPLDRAQVRCGQLPLRIVPIRGVSVARRLFLAAPARRSAAAGAFLAFVRSAAAREIVRACGYAPPEPS